MEFPAIIAANIIFGLGVIILIIVLIRHTRQQIMLRRGHDLNHQHHNSDMAVRAGSCHGEGVESEGGRMRRKEEEGRRENDPRETRGVGVGTPPTAAAAAAAAAPVMLQAAAQSRYRSGVLLDQHQQDTQKHHRSMFMGMTATATATAAITTASPPPLPPPASAAVLPHHIRTSALNTISSRPPSSLSSSSSLSSKPTGTQGVMVLVQPHQPPHPRE